MDNTPLVGQEVQGLRIVGLLGRGGMGEVYKAFDPRLQRTVAIKVISELYAVDRDFAARFAREARSASAVNHPNVAQIFSSGEFHDRPYYVMEYVEGSSLADLLRESGHLTGRRSLDFLLQAAEGLRAAAEAGIVHRDIKPANMMVDGRGRLKIVDFGLARRMAEDVRVTRSEHVLGTPTYLSPEQAQGQEVDQRSDIYSLGASFYHLLSGAPPFDGDTPIAVMLKHVGDPVPPLRERNPRVPAAVAAIIERMMAKKPEERYQRYDELIADVQAALQCRSTSGAEPGPRTVLATIAPEARSSPPWLLPGIAAVILAVIVLIVLGNRHATSLVAKRPAEDHPERRGVVSPPDDSPALGSPQEALQQLANGQRIDPQVAYGLAYQVETLANLRRVSVAVQVHESQTDSMPEALDELRQSEGLPARATLDGWGHAVRYRPTADHHFTLTSAGADGRFDSADDLEIEDGEVTKGGPPRGPIAGLPARYQPPPLAAEPEASPPN